MPKTNPIIKTIAQVFQNEITNTYATTPHSITLTLPNEQTLIIGVILTTAPLHSSPAFKFGTTNTYTYHYQHQPHTTTRLTLQSLEDCRSYIDDICHTMLNATFNDFEVTFPDGSAYLIMITPA